MSPEEQAQAHHAIQTYRETHYINAEACLHLLESLEVQQYSHIIRVALREALELLQAQALLRFMTPEYYANDKQVRNDFDIIQALCERGPTYSGEDMQVILSILHDLILTDRLISHKASMFRVISTLEAYLIQPELFVHCRNELLLFYELAHIWGNYEPIRESYRLRLLVGDLLFDGNAPGLVSLFHHYAQGSDLSLAEQAQEVLSTYHQEMEMFNPPPDHPALELIQSKTSTLLKVAILREIMQALAFKRPSSSSREIYSFVDQNEKLANLILSDALPYTIEDIQSILQSINVFFSNNKLTNSISNAYIFSFKMLDLCFPYFTAQEGLTRCRAEVELLYHYVSQEMIWYDKPDDPVDSVRLRLRKLLFPESSGPFSDLLQSRDPSLLLNTDMAAQNLLTILHKDLGNGHVGKQHSLLIQFKAKLTPQSRVRIIRLAVQEVSAMIDMPRQYSSTDVTPFPYICMQQDLTLIDILLHKSLPFMPDDIYAMLNIRNLLLCIEQGKPIRRLWAVIVPYLEQHDLLERCRPALEAFKTSLNDSPKEFLTTAEYRKYLLTVDNLLSAHQQQFRSSLLPDAWAKPILDELAALPAAQRASWLSILNHCASAKGATLNNTWLKHARSLTDAVETDMLTRTLHRWISFFSDKKGARMDDANSNILRGLIWLCTGSTERSLATILADTAIEGYRKLAGLGPRAPKVAGAAVTTLEHMPGMYAIGQLERVRLHVSQPSYQAKIGQSLDAVARRENMTRSDLEELTVPTFDLNDGHLLCLFGKYTAQLTVGGRTVQVDWADADGTQYKSVPAEVKRAYKNELKDLKRLSGDIEHMLSTQRDRLERFPFVDQHWSLAAWEERYLHHPLLSLLTRRLIWQLRTGDQINQGIWWDGQLVDVNNHPLELVAETDVSLWHPLMSSTQEAYRWRLWLEEHLVTQPFKQAHREIYPITDAERVTSNYSTRFAGHIIRQHQFNALTRVRGWTFSLQTHFSGESNGPPYLELPHWEIKAEFALQGYPDDSGIYHYLVTDQVCFLPSDPARAWQGNTRQLMTLEQVPPIIFSEVMRDIDFFVSVANAGADPYGYNQTGSLEDYWRTYNQSELSLSAEERKSVLERLIPRLAIADRCSVEDRFLTVRGDLHTYSIHLGSGNILIKPDNRYLCIVFDKGAQESSDNQYYLPFEGDVILALILSKAFLLAHDKQIKDPSIVPQIRLR
ncbi:DUF4132 domain-containing protein [Dictyobacter arantiisoli]|uniref:Uncharacterized protein n=1 Tax=Dictyobacter arantiisoli TaxID=2014874 RepID=A0A5A5TBZ0_9CHLR|nr:DUF4132 domain-containing protein [Dictyobacter arantiisoli]GCF08666.1 hypothetical protein KDI_22300 [Dictyobacter arantiisoli]